MANQAHPFPSLPTPSPQLGSSTLQTVLESRTKAGEGRQADGRGQTEREKGRLRSRGGDKERERARRAEEETGAERGEVTGKEVRETRGTKGTVGAAEQRGEGFQSPEREDKAGAWIWGLGPEA